MAKETPSSKKTLPPKLSRLSKSTSLLALSIQRLTVPDQKIQKRPLLHPAIPSPRTSSTSPKIVYISASTPFISAVKRIRTLLSHIENRASGPVDFSSGPTQALAQISAGIKKRSEANGEEIVIKGTGRAIEKVLRLATWWQGQDDVKVVLRTGSVGAVDDIVGEEGEEEGSRVRRTSSLELGIRLR